MFAHLQPAPSDPILGLMAAYHADPRPLKIDLGIGVYKDESGHTPILASVKRAEAQRLERETSKSYLGMAGDPEFNAHIDALNFGEHAVRRDGRVFTAHTPGGTGALRVAAELIRRARPEATVWMSDPTWGNHPSVFKGAGLAVREYPYYDPASSGLRADALLEALAQVPAGDVVLLHASCHNPSGVDIPAELWPRIAALASRQGWLPLVDMAYQGFAHGLEADALAPRLLAADLPELLLCSSCSKNFGLYRERIGAISIVAGDSASARASGSVLLSLIRNFYSMPPAHGAAIVARILEQPELNALWQQELAAMRSRINGVREATVERIRATGIDRDFGFIARQRGMFSFLGIDKDQIRRLREEFAVYLIDSSRINIAGLNAGNLDHFATSLATVLRG